MDDDELDRQRAEEAVDALREEAKPLADLSVRLQDALAALTLAERLTR